MSGLGYLQEHDVRPAGGGSASETAFQSWVSLKRNLREPFPAVLETGERQSLRRRLFEQLLPLGPLDGAAALELERLEPYERVYLHERRFIGRESLLRPAGRGLIIAPDARLSILVGEEDHLRIQCQRAELGLDDAFVCADSLDAELEQHLRLAFSEEFGYLTACPSEAGTGLRASLLLHLPALALQGDLPKVIRGLAALKVAIRGPFGDSQGAPGAWVLLANSRSLGGTERDYVAGLDRVARRLLDIEERALERSLAEARSLLEDELGKAVEALRASSELTGMQAVALLGTLRMGARAGLSGSPALPGLGPLELWVQAGHLQLLAGRSLDEAERRRQRAARLRDWLFPSTDTGNEEGISR